MSVYGRVRFLAFVGGLVSFGSGVFSVINPLTLVFGAVMHVVSVYKVIFSFTTIIFEEPPEYIEKVPVSERALVGSFGVLLRTQPG